MPDVNDCCYVSSWYGSNDAFMKGRDSLCNLLLIVYPTSSRGFFKAIDVVEANMGRWDMVVTPYMGRRLQHL